VTRGEEKGYTALVLHAHLPFVRHPEYEDFLEENWLFEAINETYLPLLDAFEGMVADGVDFRITVSISPSLASMFNDGLLRERYLRHLNRLIDLTGREIERTRGQGEFHDLAWMYHLRFQRARYLFEERYGKNLCGAFAKFQDLGVVELMTCAATHGFLPLMEEHPWAVRAQILTARDHYTKCFGRPPRGIWLPECAYFPGVEKFLQEADIRWFILDTHGILYGDPRPRHGIYAPVFTPSGVAAFGRDTESSKQVWSAEEGYPGDYDYREFYRDVGFDLEMDYIKPYIHPDGIRTFTGVKYYRITGRTKHKEPYRRAAALEKAAMHAGNFMFNREKQVEHLHGVLGRKPLILAPYDAELFGHWWFEGPDWINFLLRKAAYDQRTFAFTTPSEYLSLNPTQQLQQPAASSWGNKGYYEVWVEGSNSWIYPHLHMAELRMRELANWFQGRSPAQDRAIRQAARELLLMQASDWAFIMKTGTSVNYAVKRVKDHVLRFTRLYDQVRHGTVDEGWLTGLEGRDNIFPDVNPDYYRW
jgi:1,4-alpha-glucan branching enzyme